MVIYSRIVDDVGDDDLTFILRRSIQLVKERKPMGKPKGKKNGNKERASVSRERRLALALRAVLEQNVGNDGDGQGTAFSDANTVLNELGYADLQGVPMRIALLNQQLTAAVAAGDGKRIAELGLELERAKAGKEPVAVKVNAAGGGE